MAITSTPFLSLEAHGSVGPLTARQNSHRTVLAKRNGPTYHPTSKQTTHAALCQRAQNYAHNNPAYTWWPRDPFTDAAKNIFHFPSESHFWLSLVLSQGGTQSLIMNGRSSDGVYIIFWGTLYDAYPMETTDRKVILHQRNSNSRTWFISEPAQTSYGTAFIDAMPSVQSPKIDWYVTTENGKPMSGVFRDQTNFTD